MHCEMEGTQNMLTNKIVKEIHKFYLNHHKSQKKSLDIPNANKGGIQSL